MISKFVFQPPGVIIGADFIDNTMYLYDSTGIIYKYDESVYTDWNGSANVAFSKTFKLNDLHLDNKWLKLASVHVSCDGKTGGVTFELFVDGVSVNQYTVTGEKYQNMRPLITSNPRGRRFTVQDQPRRARPTRYSMWISRLKKRSKRT